MTEMIEIREDHLRAMVTAAAAQVLDNARSHVEYYWLHRRGGEVSGLRGDQAEAAGLGVDIIPEIVAMAQELWSYAQSHAANLADDVTGNALFMAILAAFHKWKPPPAGTLSSVERQAVAEELARHVTNILVKNEHPHS